MIFVLRLQLPINCGRFFRASDETFSLVSLLTARSSVRMTKEGACNAPLQFRRTANNLSRLSILDGCHESIYATYVW